MKRLLFLTLLFLPLATNAQSPTWFGASCGSSASNDPLRVGQFPTVDQVSGDYPANVWVTDIMNKVPQDAGNTPGSVKWAFPCAAKNEFEGFQVHIQAGGSNITLNSMTISDLVEPVSGTHITSSGSPANITVYAERYYNIQTKSDNNSVLGHIPDPLVPVKDPYRGQTTNAFPITVLANQTQSVWFDIFVPPTAPSGFYQGTVTVTVGGSTLATLPVVLAVWNFSLPSTSTLQNMYSGFDVMCLGYFTPSSVCTTYPGAGGNSDTGLLLAEIDIAVMMLDHRVSIAQFQEPILTSPPNTWTIFDANIGPLLNGTPANTSTILSGAALSTIIYTGCANCNVGNTNLQDWLTHFTSKGWAPKLLAWSVDEPTVCGGWTAVDANGPTYHGTTPPYQVLVTSSIQNGTTCSSPLTSIDTFSPSAEQLEAVAGNSLRNTYNLWLPTTGASNRVIWMYEACNSHGSCTNGVTGTATQSDKMIDQSPIRNRIMQFQQWLHGVKGDLYYDDTYCWNSAGCQDGNGVTDPGHDPWTYIYYSGGNGDGTLIYPGTNAKIGVANPIPLPSVRLKLIRAGYQDWEYLVKLDANNQHAFAQNQIGSIITNLYTFTTTETSYMGVRAALGNKIHSFIYSPLPISVARTKGRLP